MCNWRAIALPKVCDAFPMKTSVDKPISSNGVKMRSVLFCSKKKLLSAPDLCGACKKMLFSAPTLCIELVHLDCKLYTKLCSSKSLLPDL